MAIDCYCDYEPVEFDVETTRKARIKHRCFECKRTIAPGEAYTHRSGKFEGEMFVQKMCSYCTAFRAHVTKLVPCFCYGYGELIEQGAHVLEQCDSEAPGTRFEALRILARARRDDRLRA